MKRFIYLFLLFFLGGPALNAQINKQIYMTGIGVNLGNPMGVNYKYFFTEVDAVEALLATSWKGYSLTGLYQRHFHFPPFKIRNTHWYLGGGAHIGYWNNTAPFFDGQGYRIMTGIDGVAGIESTFGQFPFTFGFNWIPSVNITGQFGLNLFQVGITGRYIF